MASRLYEFVSDRENIHGLIQSIRTKETQSPGCLRGLVELPSKALQIGKFLPKLIPIEWQPIIHHQFKTLFVVKEVLWCYIVLPDPIECLLPKAAVGLA
mmetsp:Transcript_150436/g.276422  ORF Transcript_150436/g.276422 Transcript_150436/m.276422 type:complete len:99 (-) Transcript_150436:304-600(-)